MEAKVKKPFKGAPDDTRKVRSFVKGDTVRGELAIVAVANGWADPVGPVRETAARSAAPENKVKDGPFRDEDRRDPGERSESKRRRGRPRKDAAS